MKRKSFLVVAVFFLIVFIVVLASFLKLYFLQKYWIEFQAPCDPESEVCFVYVCDPESEECTGDPEQDTYYYKIIRRIASDTPTCDPNDEDCGALSCEGISENLCQVTYCTEDVLEEWQTCTSPEDFVQAEAPEEGDQEEVLETGTEEDIAIEETEQIKE